MATNNAINLKGPTPLFWAYSDTTQSNVTGDGTLVTVGFNQTLYNSGSYDTSTRTFTANDDGFYIFNGCVHFQQITSSHVRGYLYLTTTARNYYPWNANPYSSASSDGSLQAPYTGMLYLSAGNTVKVQAVIYDGTKVIDIYGNVSYTWFAGYYLPAV